MSAFLCSAKHISAIVNAATLAPAMRESQSIILYLTASAQMTVDFINTPQVAMFSDLLQANLDSVSALYPNAARIKDWHAEGESVFRYDEKAKCTTPIEAIKLLQSYRYQSCEHDEWDSSLACLYAARLSAELICELPGYETCAWSI